MCVTGRWKGDSGERNQVFMTWQKTTVSQFIRSLEEHLDAEVMIVGDWEMVRGCGEEEPVSYDLAEPCRE